MEENYLRKLDDPKGITSCLDNYGIVGILNILTKEECGQTVDSAIKVLIDEGCSTKLDINDPYSYHYASHKVNKYGIIGKNAVFTDILNRNRFHHNVKKAYSIVYNRHHSELLAQYDRIGWMRPVYGPKGEDWCTFDTPFIAPGIHIDVNPVSFFNEKYNVKVHRYLNDIPYTNTSSFLNENNVKNIKMGKHYQGLINLLDNYEDTGGFQCSIGGNHIIKDWYDKNKERLERKTSDSPNGRYFFDNKYDYEFCSPNRIPCPAGTMLIFDACLPHGTKPNRSGDNRMVQFLRYIPKDVFEPSTLKRRRALLNKVFKDNNLILDEIEVI